MKLTRFTALGVVVLLNSSILALAGECPADISSRVPYPREELSRSAYLESNDKIIECKPISGFDWYELQCANGAIVYQTDDFCIEKSEKLDPTRRCADFIFVIDQNGSEFKMNITAETWKWICEGTIATYQIKATAYQSAFSFDLTIRQSFRFKPPAPVMGF